MFIRRAKTRSTSSGGTYLRLPARAKRAQPRTRVRQQTLLNLGSSFAVERRHWPLLCSRIQQLLGRQGEPAPLECPQEVERQAQQIAAQLLERAPQRAAEPADLHPVDVNSLAVVRPRSVGVEAVGLWATEQLGLRSLLERLGFGARDRALAMAAVIARMARPGSERAAWRWLSERSALGELLEVDFGRLSAVRLYQASDALLANRDAIEAHLFERVTDLSGLSLTVTLHDLTNAFFEGETAAQPEARRDRSREKRADCPLPALGLVLDGSGFVRRSQVFADAVSEDTILPPRLDALVAPKGALVVMDAGGAAEANVAWLRDNGYRYLVVDRERPRRGDPDLAVALETRSRESVRVHKVDDGDETRLYCYSEARARNEQGMAEHFAARFEAELGLLSSSLSRPHTRKGLDHVRERIGRIKERSRGVDAHYDIEVTGDGDQACALTWKRRPLTGALLTRPGACCLRTNVRRWDEETLWRIYGTLTDAEAVFRSLKPEPGLRPDFHPTPKRAEGHLFITVLAYQLVQTILRRLAEHGEWQSWTALRRVLEGQQRVTATFRQQDGRTLHVRQSTRAEPNQRAIYQALGIDPAPGGIRKMVV